MNRLQVWTLWYLSNQNLIISIKRIKSIYLLLPVDCRIVQASNHTTQPYTTSCNCFFINSQLNCKVRFMS
ncbi:hypothetical protein T07_9482 [Trichinella nelsoni]|uniref:Uncharacterized protein n=1 Tax=Trichinella nelsoni TaxID=6336 RepID=A0A0V0SNI9_9BILA|nr:hypothetical protein T07_9482 [Trichinella nelsoni]